MDIKSKYLNNLNLKKQHLICLKKYAHNYLYNNKLILLIIL